jgi:hypothetical protein
MNFMKLTLRVARFLGGLYRMNYGPNPYELWICIITKSILICIYGGRLEVLLHL